MKILFLTHKFYPEIGGIEVNSEILSTAFFKAGHQIKLITWSEDLSKKSYPFEVIRNPGLFELIRCHKWADVVFENNPSLKLSWPGILFGTPNVVAIRTWIKRDNGDVNWQDRLKLWWLKKASAVISVSKAVKEKTFSNSVVIGNPYRNEIFQKNDDIEKSVEFVFLGRLVSDKGANLAIEAVAKLIKKIPKLYESQHAILTIIGDGPEMGNLKKLAGKLEIEERIIFKGALKGSVLVNSLNLHRCILIPSVWEEPFGNVALEGMACGCIPIVSDGGGLVDAVGDAGLVFNRGSVDDLVQKMYAIISKPDLELTLRDRSRDHLKNHLPEVIAKRYLEVIENA